MKLYHATNIILQIDSNVSYLSLPKMWSRTERCYYLSDSSLNLTKAANKYHKANDLVFAVSCSIINIIVSVVEAEIITLL